MTLRDGFQLAIVGIAVGAILAYGAGRVLESLLAGVKPNDLATFAAAGVLALLMTLAGSFCCLLCGPCASIRTQRYARSDFYNTGLSFPSIARRTILIGGAPSFMKRLWNSSSENEAPFIFL